MACAMNGQSDDEVVVSGLSGRLPESGSIEEFARHLFAGDDLLTSDARRWTPGIFGLPQRSGKLKDLEHFDAAFFGISGKQADAMDPQLRLLLEVAYETLVDAGVSPAEVAGSRTGVYVTAGRSETMDALCRDLDGITDGYAMTGCSASMFSNRISYTFDLKGPSMSIDTGCSSAACALVQGARDVRAGLCDAALVAGANICLDPAIPLNFIKQQMLSPDGVCASFDASGRGFARSEAVVAVLLQRRRSARRVYCAVRGARAENEGYKPQGISHPVGDMQGRLARATFEEANLQPRDVVFVEAHGTGTKVGDPEEANAIAELFCKDRQTPLLLGAVKSNMGHAELASGLCSVAKVVLAMERGVIPGNLHFNEPNPHIPSIIDGRIKVITKNTPWQGGLVAVNSFGSGGTNAHIILEGGSGSRPEPAEYRTPRLVLASGRTDEAVARLLQLAADHPRDPELHALIDAVHAKAIPGHPRRGYAILGSKDKQVVEVLESKEGRPIWFVFSGTGSQWPGMARPLLRLPAFAASIERSAKALAPYNVDLHHVIANPEADLGDVVNCFVGITGVQVALVDVLRELAIQPDGFLGHSVGEIGCAYADGALTGEQAVLCAYWRARCLRDAALAPGAMAAVGLSLEEAERRCPEDIDIGAHNLEDNVTVSGPKISVQKFMKQLSSEGVSARVVDTAGVAFHSRYIADVGPVLRERLRQVIPAPRARSPRWLSTSVPQHLWGSDQGRLCDAAYLANNLLSRVNLSDVLPLVPPRALVVELAPHGELQAVLKRALPPPRARHVPLARRDAPDALLHLLAAVGDTYVAGALPQVSRLYPAVRWPVSRGTPSLASHVGWDHSLAWRVVDFNEFNADSRSGQDVVEYDISKPENTFIEEYNIDGSVIFPPTEYLKLVWRAVATTNKLNMEQTAVVLRNVEFLCSVQMPRDRPLRLLVSLRSWSGDFEVCESNDVVAKGTVHLLKAGQTEHLISVSDENDSTPDDLPLDSDDIYKELRLRGYNYQGAFKGIVSSNARGTRGLLKYNGNWTSFIDAAIQYSLIGVDTRDLYLPKSIQRVVIDPTVQPTEGPVPVQLDRGSNVIVAGGVEICGLKTSLVARRSDPAVPKVEEQVFLPLEWTSPLDQRRALAVLLQLVLENCNVLQLKLAEIAAQQPLEDLLLPQAVQMLNGEPSVLVDATLVAGDADDAPSYDAAMSPLGVKVSNKDTVDLESCHVVLAAAGPARSGVLPPPRGFLLLQDAPGAFQQPAAQALLAEAGLVMVSRVRTATREYALLRRSAAAPDTRLVVHVVRDDFSWLPELQAAMRRADAEDLRVYVWATDPDSGIQGLGTSLRREPGGDRLRVYYLPDSQEQFHPDAAAFRAQVQRDLAFNVLRAGVWGTFRFLPLDAMDEPVQVEQAYVELNSAPAPGEAPSPRWVAGDRDPRLATTHPRQRTALCRVFYASASSFNFVPADNMFHNVEENALGLEFSGYSSTGMRVMGVAATYPALSVVADEDLTWEVPRQWSLQEAATVPAAYTTAYYALEVRGRIEKGETVLVHCGGSVGEAAIAVALHQGCTVLTTVDTNEERAYLLNRFPQLPETNITDSRSLEPKVFRLTRGRGVDVVLNSGDKQALHCLAKGGRFIHIGRNDLNTSVLKNVTFISVSLDMLLDNAKEKARVVRCVSDGVTAGVVRPLPATLYRHDQLEQAFRFKATGNDRTALIRLRDEAGAGELTPPLLAAPRTYMHSDRSYILVGGLGGFGLELARWLAERGARTLVLNSRAGVRTGYQAWCIRRLRSAGVSVLVSGARAASAAGARELLREAAARAPVAGVFHLAAVLRGGLFENQTQENFASVAESKLDVLRALDSASRELAPELQHFVAFSSVTSGRGHAGQTNYGLANSGMERLAEWRRRAGLPALAVQWGTIGDVGMFVAMGGVEAGGTVPQRMASCLATLDALLARPRGAAVVSSLVLADKRPRDTPDQDLVQTVSSILGYKHASAVSETATLEELGVDSLMSVEIARALQLRGVPCAGGVKLRALTLGKLRNMAAK